MDDTALENKGEGALLYGIDIDKLLAAVNKTEFQDLGEVVLLDTQFAKEIGFTSDLFNGYLWRRGSQVMISLIESKHEGSGNLSKLISNIEARGLTVAVPTPTDKMEAILKRKGFVPHVEYDDDSGMVQVWAREKTE